MNTYNVLQVRFEIVDEEGNLITGVGEVPPPEGEDYTYSVNAMVTSLDEDQESKWNRR